MKQPFALLFVSVLAMCAVCAAPALATSPDANDTSAAFNAAPSDDVATKPVSKKHHASKKHAAKKHASKKHHSKKAATSKVKHTQHFLKAPHASVQGIARPILGTPDPNVDEPSEMISAIKNDAQDKFWAGKRPYPEQLRERALKPPPSAPVLTGSIAQKELQKRGSEDDASTSAALRRVSFSEITGVTFDDQPLRLSASEPFRRSLDTVSFELGRPCKNQEYLGWPMQQTEQSRVDRIFEATNERLKLRGYDLQPRRARSVGSDISAFTADRGDRKTLGIWSAGDVGLLLLLCDSETPQESAYAARTKHHAEGMKPSKKSKALFTHKKKTKKKASKKTTHTLFKAHGGADSGVSSGASVATDAVPAVPASTGATQPDAPQKQPEAAAEPATAAPTPASAAEAPAAPPVEAKPEDAKPQVIPGAAAKDLPPEPTQSATPAPAPQAEAPNVPLASPPAAAQPAAAATAINPNTAFIPADAPTAKNVAKEAVKDAVKDAAPDMKAPDMKALPPQMPSPPVTDVKP